MNLKYLLSPQYLFNFNSAFVSPQEKLFFLVGLILVLLAIVLKISSTLAPTPVDSKYRGKFYGLFLSIGLSEIAWYICRYENAKFFGMPFVAWLIVLIGVVWFAILSVSALRKYSKEKIEWYKEQVKLKYLPK